MINILDIQEKLKQKFTINGELKERYNHSIGVADSAVDLNKRFNLGMDNEKVYLTGILHDCAKYYSIDEYIEILKEDNTLPNVDVLRKSIYILHSFAGKYIARDEFNINDEDILNAIYYHTCGRPNMTDLEKILFIADYTEPSRKGVFFDKVRDALDISLDYAVYVKLDNTINYLKDKNAFIYPLTLETYEFYKEIIKNGR